MKENIFSSYVLSLHLFFQLETLLSNRIAGASKDPLRVKALKH